MVPLRLRLMIDGSSGSSGGGGGGGGTEAEEADLVIPIIDPEIEITTGRGGVEILGDCNSQEEGAFRREQARYPPVLMAELTPTRLTLIMLFKSPPDRQPGRMT